MWTTLISAMGKQNKEELDVLFSALRSDGVRVIEVRPEEIQALLQTGQPAGNSTALVRKSPQEGFFFLEEGSLVFTDMAETAAIVKQAGAAVVGLEWGECQPIYGIPYVLQSLEGIGTEYFTMVYKRFRQEPLILAETKRLCIRELTCGDAQKFAALCREASIGPEKLPAPEEEPELREFMEAYIKCQYGLYGYGFWALINKESGEWIGIAGIENRESEGEYYLELGYAIIPSRRRQGYAKEACLAILRYLKEELLLEGKIKCFVLKGNAASQRTAQSIGMLQTEDVFEEFYCYERIL